MVPVTFDTIDISTLENLHFGLEEEASEFAQQYQAADEAFDWHSYYCDMISLVQSQALRIVKSITHMDSLQSELEHKHRMLLVAESYLQEHAVLKYIYLFQFIVRRKMWSDIVTCSP